MLAVANALANACFVGLWLGFLSRESLHAIDEEYYTRSKRGGSGALDIHDYHSREYNRRGLWDWEEKAITDYFAGCQRLLIIGAGGGREVLALRRLGYHVDGFESHPDLVGVANGLLREEGYEPDVRSIARDESPDSGKTYDGIIIGWAAYMLIQGTRRRVAFLRKLRTQTQAQSPILLSFFARTGTPRVVTVGAFVANVIRRLLRRELVEVGDWLAPFYAHYFTEDEITSELSQARFRKIHYNTTVYGHAVGIAV
jgi:2-polyprenyl-3-methyl-5-hydroxy-6-metoxy-1,4-benzoquinol methylase